MATRYDVVLDTAGLTALKNPETLKGLKNVRACDGIIGFLDNARLTKHEVALVTSSEFERVNLCLEVTGLERHFPEDLKFSAHDTLPVPTYKPHPAIYLFALKALGLQNTDAIAIEDSPSGTDSAVAAGIPVIGYVGASHIPAAKKEATAHNLISRGAKLVISHFDDLEAATLLLNKADTSPVFHHATYTQAPAAAHTINTAPTIINFNQ
jgi:HAD superfamily hydrolase (TIGR01509 family)